VPEGDVVWNTAKRLHAALAGQVLTRSDFRVPRYATVSLTGQLVTEAVARGKHLFIRTDRGLTVHTHLKMEGRWRVRPAAERLRESYRIRLVLANQEWQAVASDLGITLVASASLLQGQVTRNLPPFVSEALGLESDGVGALARPEPHQPRSPFGTPREGRGFPCRDRVGRRDLSQACR